PSDGAAHLLSHRQQTAAHVLHPGEVGYYAVCPSMHEQLGCKGVVLGETYTPRAAMDEDVDRRVRTLGRVDVEPLDGGGAVGIMPRSAQTCADPLAVRGVALEDLLQVWCVDALVIGRVELGLVHIEPHERSLDARPWLRRRRLLSSGSLGAHKHRRGYA